jgi:hypothetical protein
MLATDEWTAWWCEAVSAARLESDDQTGSLLKKKPGVMPGFLIHTIYLSKLLQIDASQIHSVLIPR